MNRKILISGGQNSGKTSIANGLANVLFNDKQWTFATAQDVLKVLQNNPSFLKNNYECYIIEETTISNILLINTKVNALMRGLIKSKFFIFITQESYTNVHIDQLKEFCVLNVTGEGNYTKIIK